MQISRGKYDRLPRTTAGFTAYAFDGYGLCDQMLARPALVPLIRFLFIGSRICSALPSNTVSHWCSCAPLPFTSIRLGEDFHFQAVIHCSAHISYHPQSGWFEEAPRMGAFGRAALKGRKRMAPGMSPGLVGEKL